MSYADIITILLILFAAMAAQAVQPRAIAGGREEHRLPDALDAARHKLMEKGLDPHVDQRGVVISLPQAVLFAPGDDQISEDSVGLVAAIADVLDEVPNRVILVGHADSSPVLGGRFRNNFELSAARGVRLLELLSERFGIPEGRLSTAGQGSNSPVESNDTADGRAANRRVEIVIVNDENVSGSANTKRN